MKSALTRLCRLVARTPRLSAAGFLVYAAVVLALYGVLHALGLRRCVGVICGTPHALLGSQNLGRALGGAYIVLYLAARVAAPILVIAAGAFAVLARLTARRPAPDGCD